MYNRPTGILELAYKQVVSPTLLVVLVVSQISFIAFLLPSIAEASQVTVTGSANQNATSHNITGSRTVFISDQVGYTFYRTQPSNGPCVYSKTTDGGVTWGTAVTVDAQTDCIAIAVWYDKWTPGNFGNNIHIVTIDTGDDELFYNRLDTDTDTLLMGANALNTDSGKTISLTRGTNLPSISVATDGTVYMAVSDADGVINMTCSASCNLVSSWTEISATSPLASANDWNLLAPLPNGNMMLINRQLAAPRNIQSTIWNGTSWSSFSTIESNVITNGTYDGGMALTIDHSNGDILFVYSADNNNFTTDNHDIRTARYSAGTWTNTSDVFTNTSGRGLHNVGISIDSNTGTVYVGYSIRTTISNTATGNVFWATSTASMVMWGSEQGPISSVSGNLYGFEMNIMSDERIYATWYDATVGQIIRGATIANISPITRVSERGSQQAAVTAPATTAYLGGAFVVQEFVATRTVSALVISEIGSIDASTHLSNVRIRYDLDTTAPYDCVSESHSNSDSQFGDVVVGGFSGADGIASFTDSVTISPTQALCLYVEVDVNDASPAGDTIQFSIENPVTDVLVSGGVDVAPDRPITLTPSTVVISDTTRQTGYHWRLDDGSETAASSATAGVENTPLLAVQQNQPRRLRLAVSNNGSTSTPPLSLRLEYGQRTSSCSVVSLWTEVATSGAHFDMFDSTFIANADNTTDIPIGDGGVSNPNTTFLPVNSALLDTSPEAGALVLTDTEFVELEFSIEPTTNSIEGATYCFRVTNAGSPLKQYVEYPELTVSADVTVSSIGLQVANATVPQNNFYIGGAFGIRENASSRTVEEITITQIGTVNGLSNLSNIRLYYDFDTTAPYDCTSETYTGTESQFGSAASSFSAPNGTATFTDNVSITTTQALCVYVVIDVGENALNGETLAVSLASGGNDIVLSSGSIAPQTEVALTGTTTLLGSDLVQYAYHWRKDDGSEAGATSATNGNENIAYDNYILTTPIRLRLGVHNVGSVASPSLGLRLEYGINITTCSAVSVWEPVAPGNAWEPFVSPNLTHAADTTNISLADGGISDIGSKNFMTPNSAVRTTDAITVTGNFTTTDFYEYEFSLRSASTTAPETSYCFRLAKQSDSELAVYDQYPQVITAPNRDYRVQRGVVTVTAANTTLMAGIDYVAPSSTSSAFVRITNTHHTGSGRDDVSANLTSRDTSVTIDSNNIINNFTLSRAPGAINNTRVYWELIEFIGPPGTDNEMIVREQGSVSMNSPNITANGSVVAVTNPDQVVVYVTGVTNSNNTRNQYYAQQVTAEWDTINSRPVFTRGAAGTADLVIGYAVVEYTGLNWRVQRVEHTYTDAGVAETETIIPVNNISRTFTHTQKRMEALGNVNNFGHEVWLSSIGTVSFRIEPVATSPGGHTSVAWIIENMQTRNSVMKVQRSTVSTNGGTAPLVLSESIAPVSAENNTSLFAVSRALGANTAFPRPLVGVTLTSTSTYEIFRSNSGSLLTLRTEIVEWPTQGLALRQHYYRIYANNDSLLPIDPWPPGPSDLGENMPLTEFDESIGTTDVVRLRMAIRTDNASWPAGLYQFKLQYGVRATTCSAVSAWQDVGDELSGSSWRLATSSVTNGSVLSTNPPNGNDLVLSVSTVAGIFSKTSPTVTNPYTADIGDFVEFDWPLEHNGALQRTTYCFRMVYSDNEPLDGYLYYPQIRTAGFTPAVTQWRWYDDVIETPVSPLTSANIAPTEIANQNHITLRVALAEQKNVTGNDARFYLQYDESPLFNNPAPVTASSSCTEFSRWCYADVVINDNTIVTTALLSASEPCTSAAGNGCGTHHTSPTNISGFTHTPGSTREYAFYLESRTARVGAVYYFRLVEAEDNIPVRLASGASYPNLVSESSLLTFTIDGLPAGTTTAGVVLDATSTPTDISFPQLLLDTPAHAAHRITINANASEGYQVFVRSDGALLSSHGGEIPPVLGVNSSPLSWITGCDISATGCFGYHTTDAVLSGISTRFVASDSFAALTTNLEEIMYSPVPSNDIHDILYKIEVRAHQPAGLYEANIMYVAVPIY